MLKGLFADSGIPSYETFHAKLTSLRNLLHQEKNKRKKRDGVFIDSNGNIAHLPDEGTAAFIGDLHGDFEAIVSIVSQLKFFDEIKSGKNMFLVFLGDYGDRGAKTIKTIHEAITLKLSYPKNVVLLKGNHEERITATSYGTYDDFFRAYGRQRYEPLFDFYCQVMSELPVAAITANGIIGVHGGIPNQDIESLAMLNAGCISEMTWNDPDPSISERGYNPRGGTTKTFGRHAFERFMKIVPANLMVRSHEYPSMGVRLSFENRLATIFSSGSERSQSSAYSHCVRRPVFLKIPLSEKKDKFQEQDFIEILY